MNTEELAFNQQEMRGTDSNSLLRMYDLANRVLQTSGAQQERARAGKAVERICKELRKRNVAV